MALCKISFSFVATINLSIGNPIFFARYPAKTSPKFPVGTEKEILSFSNLKCA